ncbi:hypothetical protein PIB30_044396 [Stylosanthes scabra]|uniref:Uncharacterized protein n=1 Tax=Stylosanthes scabra TaxID=79078 RepID=A0ABU6XH40_9FABA|nr:hypothetical protein [Stylosanthes scabra]
MFVNEHICSRRDDNNAADQAWVTEELQEKLRHQPDLTTTEAGHWFNEQFRLELNYKKIQRAMKKARENIGRGTKQQHSTDHYMLPRNRGPTAGHNSRGCQRKKDEPNGVRADIAAEAATQPTTRPRNVKASPERIRKNRNRRSTNSN